MAKKKRIIPVGPKGKPSGKKGLAKKAAPQGNYYTNSGRIKNRFTMEPMLAETLTDVKELVDHNRGTPDNLSQALGEYFTDNPYFMEMLKAALAYEVDQGDRGLKTVMSSLQGSLINNEFERQYVVRRVCDSAIPSLDETLPEKICTHVEVIPHVVDSYVLESEFTDRNWKNHIVNGKQLFMDHDPCPKCGDYMGLWSSSNRSVPSNSDIVAFIDTRVKSDGRRNAKLTEIICGDDLRHLDDDYGFMVVLRNVDKYHSKKRLDPIEKFTNSYIGNNATGRANRKFLNHLGIELPGKMSLLQRLHYAMFCHILGKVKENSVAPVSQGLDNDVIIPQKRWNARRGIMEYRYGLRARAEYGILPIEFQIITEKEYNDDNNPLSAKFHLSYAQKERERQKKEWSPEHRLVLGALNKHFTRMG